MPGCRISPAPRRWWSAPSSARSSRSVCAAAVTFCSHEVRTLAVKSPELNHEASEVPKLHRTQAAQVSGSSAHLGRSGASAGATVGGKTRSWRTSRGVASRKSRPGSRAHLDQAARASSGTISVVPSPQDPIGVFDSGVGGLTVLHELLVSLPAEDYLYLGRHRAVSLRRAHAGRVADVRDRDRRAPDRRRSEAAGGRLQRCQRGRARRAREAPRPDGHDVDVIGVLEPGRPAGRRGQPHGPDRPAGDARDGRQRRLRAGGRRRRSARPPESVACPDLAPIIQAGLPVRRARRRDRSRVLRAAARRRGRHGHPRLHALPAGRPDAPADAGRGVSLVDLRHGGGAERRAGSGRPRPAQSAQPARAATASSAQAMPDAFRELGTRFLQMPLGDGRSRRAPARLRGMSARALTGAMDAHAGAISRPTTIEPGFVRTATGSALISVGETRVICTASVAGERAALAGRLGPRLGHGRVRDAAGVDRRAQAARRQQGQAGRPDGRDPAPDRTLAARRGRLRRRSASARSTSTATCSRPTAARAARRSPAAWSRCDWRASAS